MKRAFLVVGAESSGTRLLTRILIAGGCAGDDSHHQPFDHWEFGEKSPVVWRRSFPWTRAHLWPNLELDLLKPLRSRDYEPAMVLVSTRDWLSLSRSQADLKNHHVLGEAEALENVSIAYHEIFKQIGAAKLPYLMVAHEAIVLLGEAAIRPLLRKLGLNEDAQLPHIDQHRNASRYT
jgi:hypothetical protein